MAWADNYIAKLKNGETIEFRPRGNSMVPTIKSGDLCTIEPINGRVLRKGDIVLCTVSGAQYLHKIIAIKDKIKFQIGNNHGNINGWTNLDKIYGVLTRIE